MWVLILIGLLIYFVGFVQAAAVLFVGWVILQVLSVLVDS